MMLAQQQPRKSLEVDFYKDYEKIIKESGKFPKTTNQPTPKLLDSNQPFEKFSIYSDNTDSITSFNTNAVL